jgi:hypothetical protein
MPSPLLPFYAFLSFNRRISASTILGGIKFQQAPITRNLFAIDRNLSAAEAPLKNVLDSKDDHDKRGD